MQQKQKIFHLMLLDESGSMQPMQESIIRGFNETVLSIKSTQEMHPEQDQYITLVTFNGAGIKTILSNQPVADLHQLTGASYKPDHATPLYDAMGFALTRLKTQLELLENRYVLVTILTDGEENASKEWSANAIKHLVEELRAKDWTFTYIGTNHDVAHSANKIAVPNALTYSADEAGIYAAFQRDRVSRSEYMRQRKVGLPLVDNYFQEKN